MKPSIGRIVIYHPSDEEKKEMYNSKNCNEQEQLPAVITAVWGDECVNLKVLLDGIGELWKTSANLGTNVLQWSWPEKV